MNFSAQEKRIIFGALSYLYDYLDGIEEEGEEFEGLREKIQEVQAKVNKEM